MRVRRQHFFFCCCWFCYVFILPAAGGAKAEQAPVFHLKAKKNKNQCRVWTTLLAREAQLSRKKKKKQSQEKHLSQISSEKNRQTAQNQNLDQRLHSSFMTRSGIPGPFCKAAPFVIQRAENVEYLK